MHDEMYYLMSQDVQTGPFHIDQIRSMWASGTITADALCWAENWSSWKPVADLVLKQELASENLPKQTQQVPIISEDSSPISITSRHLSLSDDDEFFCCRCSIPYKGKTKTSWLGLETFQCSSCGHINKFPPSRIFTGCCWIIVVISLVFMWAVMASGGLAFPGLFLIAALSAISESIIAKRKIRASRKFFSERARMPKPEQPVNFQKQESTDLPKFFCTHCGYQIESVVNFVETTIPCPICAKSVTVPVELNVKPTAQMVLRPLMATGVAWGLAIINTAIHSPKRSVSDGIADSVVTTFGAAFIAVLIALLSAVLSLLFNRKFGEAFYRSYSVGVVTLILLAIVGGFFLKHLMH